jgi:apolipoprotein N-acyltransferase
MTGPDPASPPGPALARLRARLLALGPWRRRAAAAGLGVLSTLALPPVHLVPLLIPAFSGLVWMSAGAATPRRAFAVGWWFGFGAGVTGLYWIGIALTQDAVRLGPLGTAAAAVAAPVAVAAGLAVFPGAVAALHRLSGARGWGGVLVFAAIWTAVEWVRGWILTGFPWNLMGTVWDFSDAMVQLAAFSGVWGLSLVTVAAAAMPATLVRGARPTVLALAALAVVWAGGLWRLAGPDPGAVPGVALRLVQANIPQKLKWKRELRRRHLETHLRMSTQTGGPAPTHVIWAETAVPFFLATDAAPLAMVGTATPKGGITLTGAPRRTPRGEKPFRVWNSLHAIDDGGRVVATYDKHHLVPFGEYVPFRDVLGIDKITAGGTDFTAGPGRAALRLPGLPPVSPLICYEAIFPGRVLPPGDRPEWLLNLTNDGWYGRSSGPYQHLAAARLRAVEEGMPLVRVANTGISAVVDARGRYRARLGLGETGVLDSGLPRPLAAATVYARLGDWVAAFVVLAVGGAGLLASAGAGRPAEPARR